MTTELPHADPRRSIRVPLTADVSLRRSGQLHYQVKVLDLSPHGCRIEFIERPALEEQMWVRFDGLQALEAEVCWVDGFVGGLNFFRPIHPAVFDQLLSRLGPACC